MEEENLVPFAVKLSPEVSVAETTIFVVRMDTKEVRKGKETGEVCFFEDKEVANHALESLANQEVKRLTVPGVRIYRQNASDPSPYIKRIDILQQKQGYLIDGTIETVATLGFVQVPFATYSDSLME